MRYGLAFDLVTGRAVVAAEDAWHAVPSAAGTREDGHATEGGVDALTATLRRAEELTGARPAYLVLLAPPGRSAHHGLVPTTSPDLTGPGMTNAVSVVTQDDPRLPVLVPSDARRQNLLEDGVRPVLAGAARLALSLAAAPPPAAATTPKEPASTQKPTASREPASEDAHASGDPAGDGVAVVRELTVHQRRRGHRAASRRGLRRPSWAEADRGPRSPLVLAAAAAGVAVLAIGAHLALSSTGAEVRFDDQDAPVTMDVPPTSPAPRSTGRTTSEATPTSQPSALPSPGAPDAQAGTAPGGEGQRSPGTGGQQAAAPGSGRSDGGAGDRPSGGAPSGGAPAGGDTFTGEDTDPAPEEPSPVPAPPLPAGESDRAAISTYRGKCLDVAGGAAIEGAAVQVDRCDGSAIQTWTLISRSTIKTLGKCLSAPPVRLASCDGSENQQWSLASARLHHRATGLCLVVDGAPRDGAPVTLAPCSSIDLDEMEWWTES